MLRNRHGWSSLLHVALAATLWSVLCFGGHLVLGLHGTPPLVDEGIHSQQITRFLEGDTTPHPGLTTLPGYHAVIATLCRVLGGTDLTAMRWRSTLVGLLSVLLFASLARRLTQDRTPWMRTAHYVFQPLLFPFFYLVYTDPLSLLLLFASMRLMLAERPTAAGIVGILGLLVRQTNVVWLGFLVAWDYGRRHGAQFERHRIAAHLRTHAASLCAVPLFVAFVVWNGGVARGDRTHHEIGFHLGNVWFFPLVALVAFAPVLAAQLPQVVARLRHRPVQLAVGLGFALYWFTFESPHPYNQVPGHLRNGLLVAMQRSDALRAVVYVPIAYGALALWTLPLRRTADRWIFLFAVVALVPASLIEQRYMLFPLLAVLLFRRRASDRVERLSLLYEVAASLVVLRGFARDSFFL